MKKQILTILAAALTAVAAAAATAVPQVNLTPRPKSITAETEGTLTLPSAIVVAAPGLGDEWTAEATKFASALALATGADVSVGAADGAFVSLAKNDALAPEGYTLKVDADGIRIEASTPAGAYFAFQTVKKILPANVMAGVYRQGEYTIPYLTINDEPRYEYRGFMLDVARHFFTVEEVKRMIDVMSYYKLNFFHWHLTDDQGWRIEMPDYPRLTTIAATSPNSRFTDMHSKTQYWINKPYGPYFYTQDQMREVVAYAAERHITVVPEVEMPDHLCAAMTAYPEFSCDPDGAHRVWDDGGISTDVLNVANPAALKFARDIIDTLCDIFPSELIHIGGDECPAGAWQNNAECKAYYEANGFTNIRQHQSRFCKEMADYARTKGRRVAFWNEAVTYDGMDLDEIKSTGATIYCWTGADNAAKKAQELGLPCVYTPWGPYYINRRQHPDDPPAAGGPNDDVKATFNCKPFGALTKPDNDLCYGVQGTFWCEHVSDAEYMEWLALPRLIAIAEIGWTPQSRRNFTNFIGRVAQDRELLDLGGYRYTEHYMPTRDDVDPDPGQPATPVLAASGSYIIENVAFPGLRLTAGATLGAIATADVSNLWNVTINSLSPDNATQFISLKGLNDLTISGLGAHENRLAKAVSCGSAPVDSITVKFNADGSSAAIAVNGNGLWPLPADAIFYPSTARAGNTTSDAPQASAPQGNAWKFIPAEARTFVCTDSDGNSLGTFVCGVPVADSDADAAPAIANHELLSATRAADNTISCVYRRTAFTVTYSGVADGIPVVEVALTVEPGAVITPQAPEVKGLTPVSVADGQTSITVNEDTTIPVVYSAEGCIGIEKPLATVSSVEDGKSYLLRDAHSDRNAWRGEMADGYIRGTKVAADLTPSYIWTLEANGNRFKIRNHKSGRYIPALQRSTPIKTSAAAHSYSFTFNDNGYWTIADAAGLCWDGLDNLSLVGWNNPGHPIEIYEFFGKPLALITINSVDTKGNKLASTERTANYGEAFTVGAPFIKGYSILSVDGAEGLRDVQGNSTVTITYIADGESSISEISAPANGNGATGIYDLRGRRLERISAPGIYIVNGTKLHVR